MFKTPAGDRVANNHIDLSVRPGELVVLAGPSGAGKTTLLNLLAGLDRPTSGQVTLAGQNYAQSSDRQLSKLRREYIGYVFQSFGLLPMLSARENVEVPLRLLRMPAAERDARVDEVLADVGLTGHGEQRPYELSGGQQQRVSLARALVARPRLLLADEPTAQLDSATAGTVLELIQQLVHRLGVAAVVTTHDQSLMALADRVVLLHDGTAVNAPASSDSRS
ncbi:MAG: ABC transporter ATP-binding protein [Actinomycetota bacterium]|nr:ABC transporter ATP-binding protein [Actinomycetota bacterium]